ncbi:MAG TPA: RNA-binding cell elongation regulator Jag/EloR [Acidimicrobiales bacterium]|nr:RNA-binding cell elongation regulator Jag/EloR [Acidimicrobiales bacterium]
METTGRSVQEAKDAALDELGVDEADAEFEVLAEAQTGLFGRLRSEARVRARVRPTAPRAKEDRRDRRDRRRRAASTTGEADTAESGAVTTETAPPAGRAQAPSAAGPGQAAAAADGSGPGDGAGPGDGPADEAAGAAAVPAGSGSAAAPGSSGSGGDGGSGPRRRRNRRRGGKRPGEGGPSEARLADLAEAGDDDDHDEVKGPQVEVALEQQAEVASDFLTKLTAELGVQAAVNVARPDEDTVELQLSGPDLGILIGPKGATLSAIQNLTRTVVFNETGANNGHINVDVGGYRQKRSEALVRFASQVADRVKQSGARTVLEPMSAVDRKVVHDAIAGIDGVHTISEGEEPRRRVVVLPD